MLFEKLKARGGFTGEDRAELAKVERMRRTFAAREKRLTVSGRSRPADINQRFSIEEVVRRMTSDAADAAGLADRGRIAPGQKADLDVIDFDRVSFGRPYVAFDLPAGGRRLLQKAGGYEATIVSGAVT